MRMVDLIEAKKNGQEFNEKQWQWIIDHYVKDEIPDYQMSALLMAICFQELSDEETTILTKCMLYSGEVIDLSAIEGIKVDKHSTGGVGDKISLILGPMVSACHAKVAKMSGRGLGHTGGTLDKLESIPGFNIHLNKAEFINTVNQTGIAIIGQTAKLVPADQKMYGLRDVTATVACIPLIAASIMSKKLASGSDAILLDVKYGDGAFMKTKEDAITLARLMIEIGKGLNRDTRATISNMNQPLGYAIGNSLEVIEAIEVLQGKGPSDVLSLCLQAGSHMLVQSKVATSLEDAIQKLQAAIDTGSALNKLKDMVNAQGGNGDYIDHPELFTKASIQTPIYATKSGYIHQLHARSLGEISMHLGGGRQTKEDQIDHQVGIVLNHKVGDQVKVNDLLGVIHSNQPLSDDIITQFHEAFEINVTYCEKTLLIDEILV